MENIGGLVTSFIGTLGMLVFFVLAIALVLKERNFLFGIPAVISLIGVLVLGNLFLREVNSSRERAQLRTEQEREREIEELERKNDSIDEFLRRHR